MWQMVFANISIEGWIIGSDVHSFLYGSLNDIRMLNIGLTSALWLPSTIVDWHINKLGKHQPNIGITSANININHYQNYEYKHFPIHFGFPRLIRKTFSLDLKKLTAVSESLSLC